MTEAPQKPAETCPGSRQQERLSLPAPPLERPTDLTHQIRTLERALRDLRPFQLTRPDEKALADLLHTLLRLARAHAGRGRLGLIFPSIEEAEQAARRR